MQSTHTPSPFRWWNVSQDKSGKWVIDDWEPAMKEAAAAMREHGPFDGEAMQVLTEGQADHL